MRSGTGSPWESPSWRPVEMPPAGHQGGRRAAPGGRSAVGQLREDPGGAAEPVGTLSSSPGASPVLPGMNVPTLVGPVSSDWGICGGFPALLP